MPNGRPCERGYSENTRCDPLAAVGRGDPVVVGQQRNPVDRGVRTSSTSFSQTGIRMPDGERTTVSDAMIEGSVGRQLDEELAQVGTGRRIAAPARSARWVSENRLRDAVISTTLGVIGTAIAPSGRVDQIVRRRRHHACGPRCILDDHLRHRASSRPAAGQRVCPTARPIRRSRARRDLRAGFTEAVTVLTVVLFHRRSPRPRPHDAGIGFRDDMQVAVISSWSVSTMNATAHV